MDWLWDETGRLRTAWRFAIFGFGFIVLQFGVGLAVMVGLGVYLAFAGKLNDLRLGPDALSEWLVPLQMIAGAPISICIIAFTMVCRRYLDRRSVASMGLVSPGTALFDSVAGGFLWGLVLVLSVIGVLFAAGALAWEGISASLETALLIPVLVVMAFFEEIVCRGYLLQNLLDIRRPIFGVLFTATVFWILHGLNPSAWSSPIVAGNLFFAGITLALAYLVSGNIWFPTPMHFAWNLTQGVLFQLPISGIPADGLIDVRVAETAPVWLTGGSFGIEGSLLCTIAEVCTSVVFGIVLWKRTKSLLGCPAESSPVDAAPQTVG